ncbi:MAG: alpha/beta hydrolase [Actinomycetales bacterium]|nr:alpha/beta hydrolase [Actinomycetales bacterium]
MSSLPFKTRAIAALQARTATPVSEVVDFAEHRKKRQELVMGRAGKLLMGRPDRRVTVEEIDVTLNGRTLRALVYRPTGVGGVRPVVVNFHGGGWVQGSPEQSGWVSGKIAAQTGATVIAPSYRLAPEHPWPAAVEDSWETLGWIVEHAERLNIDPDRLAIMGDSAGANLAAVAALRARDALAAGSRARNVPRIRLQVLVYPSVDMYQKFSSELRMPNEPVLTSEAMDTFARVYMGDAYGDTSWLASPLRAESHADLPPALIVTAGRDPLLDNGIIYRETLRKSGVNVEYREYPRAVHGFLSLPGAVPAAHEAATDIADVIAAHIVIPR